jgi:hypothetical protein
VEQQEDAAVLVLSIPILRIVPTANRNVIAFLQERIH